mgnify:CR=1 FL=1
MKFIGILCILLFLTMLAGHFCRRIEFPAVIGEIMIGVILGPAMLNLIHLNSFLNLFSNIGVIILMFLGGLESDLSLLKKYAKPAIIVATLGVIFPVVFMGGLSYLFGFPLLNSIFIGVIFSATSVSISVSVMKEYNILDTREGATILGAAVADDVIGVILLSLMTSIVGQTSGGLVTIGWILLKQVIFFACVYVIVRWLSPLLMHLSLRFIMPSSSTIMAIVICFGVAWLAEAVGLSSAVGAFFAGIAVANSECKVEADQYVEPIGDAIFIPIFFVCVGLNTSTIRSANEFGFILAMTILGVLTKLFGCGLGARVSKFNLKSSVLIGAGMISRGEMALITAQIGFADHLMTNEYYSTMIIIIVLITLIAPLFLKVVIAKNKKSTVPNQS